MKALALAVLLPASPALGYQGGDLKNHSHSSAAGQGGASLTPASVIVSTLTASSATLTAATITKLTVGTLSSNGAFFTMLHSSAASPTTIADQPYVGVDGSTIPLTVPAGCTADVYYSCSWSWEVSFTASHAYARIIVDSVPGPVTCDFRAPVNSHSTTCAWSSVYVGGLSAGAHNIAAQAQTSGGGVNAIFDTPVLCSLAWKCR